MNVYSVLYSVWNEKENVTTFQVLTIQKTNIVEVAGQALNLEWSWNNGQDGYVYKFVAAGEEGKYDAWLNREFKGRVTRLPE